jgi:tRNA A37 N6-isopentenylltransferase MiaA
MPAAKNDRIDALIKEVLDLKSEIKELRILLIYELLKTEDPRFRGSDTLLALTKQALKVAVEQLADLDRKTDVRAREVQRSTKEPVRSRKDVSKPMVDVDKEIAILKKEMATSLRNAAKEIEEEDADEEEEDTG